MSENQFTLAENHRQWEEERRQFIQEYKSWAENLRKDPVALERFVEDNTWPGESFDLPWEKGGKIVIDRYAYCEEYNQRQLQEFGCWLQRLRLRAGFKSLDNVVHAIRKGFAPQEKKKKFVSKSTLSLYERGKVKHIDPETLWILAQVYSVNYNLISFRWAVARYHISVPIDIYPHKK